MAKAKKTKSSASTLGGDFEKKKAKLSKGKQAATNATNTSYKARSIALPQQSINRDRDQAPTTKRNLTLDDLITQTRHHNASTRKDALYGLREIFSTHPVLLPRSLGNVIPDAARLISDDDASVRKGLHAFLSSYLPHFSRNRLRPYASTLLLFTSTALSHIFPDVRIDAVRVLDLLVDALGSDVTSGWQAACQPTENRAPSSNNSGAKITPASVADASLQQHGARILQCYTTLLGISFESGAGAKAKPASASIISTDLPSASRLIILQSLLRFLQRGSTSKETSSHLREQCPTWYFEAAFASRSDFDAFEVSLQPGKRRELQSQIDGDTLERSIDSLANLESTLGKGWNVEDLSASVKGAAAFLQTLEASEHSKTYEKRNSPYMRLFSALAPVLITNFLDSAPTAFPPSMSHNQQQQQQQQLSTHAKLVCVVSNLALVLWRGVAQEARDANGNILASSSDRETLSRLVNHMTPYFPFAGLSSFCDGPSWSVEAREELLNLSMTYCELVALLSMAETKPQNPAKRQTKGKLQGQLDEVSRFVSSIITGQLQSVDSGAKNEAASAGTAARSVSDQAYANLLPTVWLLLSRGSDAASVEPLIDALLRHWKLLKATDPAKDISTEFIGRLILLSTYSSCSSGFQVSASSAQRLEEWLGKDVPRYLWELGGRDPASSERALELLRCVVSLSIFPKLGDSLQSTLVPFFHFTHPSRGAISGPYTRLTPYGQAQARGLLAYLTPLSPALKEAATAVGL